MNFFLAPKQKPCCVLCAMHAGRLQPWIDTKNLCLSGWCAYCGLISATVVLPVIE